MSKRTRQAGNKPASEERKTPTPLSDFDRMFNEVAQRQVTLRTSGGTVRMSLLEATLMKAFETASAGSAHAQRNVLNHAMAIETKKQEQIAYDVAEWTEYRNITSEAIAISQQAGLPEPEFGIHPEDIRIDPQNGVSFTGPIGEEEIAQYKRICLLRDALLIQAVFEQRDQKEPKNEQAGPNAALALAMLINHSLPKRMQLKGHEPADRMMELNNLTKRELLKQLTQAWRKAGIARPRGSQIPSLRYFEHLLHFMSALWLRVEEGEDKSDAAYQMITDDLVAEFS